MAERRIFAVDGGNSKTDAVLLADDGTLLAAVRGAGSSPHQLGLHGSLAVLDRLAAAVRGAAERATGPWPGAVADVGAFLLAGIDSRREERAMRTTLAARGWASVTVDNDTLAVLRAGAPAGWGLAVVCGAGINCLAVRPDGRRGGYQALGPVSGDWGGGIELGYGALGAAIRSDDGRGPMTVLADRVATEYGVRRARTVADRVHRGILDETGLARLAPVVLAAARDGDGVAGALVDRLATEIVTMSVAVLRRLRMLRLDVPVVLGGGVLLGRDPRLLDAVGDGIRAAAPRASVVLLEAPPVLGAALVGLARSGAGPDAEDHARAALRELRPEPLGVAE